MSKIFVADKLKIRGTKTLSTIALVLILTFSALMAAMPAAKAHTPPWTIPTYAFLNVAPNPVGVGQAAFVNFWIDKVAPTANSQYGDRWQNFKVTVTKPDGTTATLGPFTSDDVGGAFTTYIPTATGSYTFVFSFPGQTIAGANPAPTGTTNPQQVGDYFQPSTSTTVTLVVQQQQIQSYPSTPLPTGYWQRPIFAMNTNWYSISGNWLGTGLTARMQNYYNASGNFNPYTTAPNTAHIVWTKPYAPGGLIGGQYGSNEMNSMYYATAQYEPKFGPPIIMNGVLYYEEEPGSSTNIVGWLAVDLHTGQTIWTHNSTTTTLRMGQVEDYVSPNQFGGLAYLWSTEPAVAPNTGTTLGMYDAMTGNWILNMVNATTPTVVVEGSDGSLLGYYINSATMTLNMWNSTQAVTIYSNTTGQNTNTWQWRPPQGAQIPWSMGLMWSKPLVTTMTASNGTTVNINAAYAESSGASSNTLAIQLLATSDVILVSDLPGAATAFQQPGYIITEAYSATTGQLLWGPLNQTQNPWSRLTLTSIGNGVYTIFTYETMSWSAYSLTTGQKLWGPVTGPNNAWSYYNMYSIIANGTLYAADLGGYVNAYDVQTGKLLWTFFAGSSGYETPYGIWPLLHVEVVADGKLYVQCGHEYSPPLFHGAQLYCLNATSGAPLWSIFDFPISNYPNAAISDGYMVIANGYDNQIYCFGKGQSATTVSAPDTAIPQGTPVLIQGTVTDQSPGQTCLGIPAKGTPAISDASMSQWMEYLYQQQPEPTNATGVPVTLTAVDPNGNTQNIGTVTSDILGSYAISWTPPVPGLYTVVANFAGSNSYYSSLADTHFVVAAAAHAVPASPQASATVPPTTAPAQTAMPSTPSPEVTATPVPAPSSPGLPTTYIVIAIVAIILVVAAAALALRRRK